MPLTIKMGGRNYRVTGNKVEREVDRPGGPSGWHKAWSDDVSPDSETYKQVMKRVEESK
jgi:hypothetical protein